MHSGQTPSGRGFRRFFLLRVLVEAVPFGLGSKHNDNDNPRAVAPRQTGTPKPGRRNMKVSDILHVKGNTLYTVAPETKVQVAVQTMAEYDIGSLVVMEYGELVGMLTFREVIKVLAKNNGTVGDGTTIRKVMDDHPLTCTLETEVNEVRRMMLERHARYLPVLDNRTLMGVISFYDVAKAVFEEQNFENKMLKAYIRDWPEEKANED
jgi:CBS domain-containing protein